MGSKYNFTRSDIKMLILSLLSNKDMYGYQIIQELKLLSNSYFSLQEGSLYPLLHSLQSEELINSYWEETLSMRKKKYYVLTQKGKRALAREQKEWEKYFTCINNILEGGEVKNELYL